jgi:hypothetical protein
MSGGRRGTEPSSSKGLAILAAMGRDSERKTTQCGRKEEEIGKD